MSSSETMSVIRQLTPPQDDFIFSKDDFVCIKGTWGCGKSLAGLIAARIECEQYPNNLYLIIRKEYVDLRDSTIKDWNSEFGDIYPVVSNDVKFPNGSVIMFRHGDDLNALKNANLGGALMVQAEEMSEEDFHFLVGRLRRKDGTRQLRLECNYDGHNWIYRLFNEQHLGKLILTNTFDNIANLPDGYIDRLKKLPEKIQRRHLYGSDEEMEGIIWDEFKFSHVVAPFEVPDGWNKIVALDHGVTNPTAILWGAIDFDGKIFIFDEHYEANKTVSYHSQIIKTKPYKQMEKWLIDPSCFARTQQRGTELRSIVDEYKDYDIHFQPADNSVLGGLNRVNEWFKSDKLFIFKNCENLIREIQGYKWKKLRYTEDKNQPDEPQKKNDHACDCLRYMIMSRYDKSIVDTTIEYPETSAMGLVNRIKAKQARNAGYAQAH